MVVRPSPSAAATAAAASSSVRLPRLYLGTMTFGWSQTSSYVDEKAGVAMLEKFVSAFDNNDEAEEEGQQGFATTGGGRGQHHVDTARIYAGEDLVGKCLARLRKQQTKDHPPVKILLGTKAHPSQKGGLSAEGILRQFDRSVNGALGGFLPDGGAIDRPLLEEYYLHQPDPDHDLLESLRCLHELVEQGRIRHIGMSNYHSSEMERAFELCDRHDLTPPSVYQGLYNPLNRAVETDLLPLLRSRNCRFVAYNPLAAGLLAGKHLDDQHEVKKGRFKDNPNYLPRFYTPSNFEALSLIRTACDDESWAGDDNNNSNLTMVEATYRWLLRHSALTENDGLLLGASSVEQLGQNLDACAAAASAEKGPLPDEVVEAFEEAWAITEAAGVFPYWRSYSRDMPNRASLDQGASYEASAKKKK